MIRSKIHDGDVIFYVRRFKMGLSNSKREKICDTPVSLQENTELDTYEETLVTSLKQDDYLEEYQVNEIPLLRECRSTLFELVEKNDTPDDHTHNEVVTRTDEVFKLTLSELECGGESKESETLVQKINIRSIFSIGEDENSSQEPPKTKKLTTGIEAKENVEGKEKSISADHNVLNDKSENFPVSEPEKMLQLYKREQASQYISANTNKKDKKRHKPKPQYKTSNLYETDDHYLSRPTRIESDLLVHPSTSSDTVKSEIKSSPINKNVKKKDFPLEPTENKLDKVDVGNDKSNLIRSVLEERSPYTKDPRLIPGGVGKPGSEKMKVWKELVDQQIVSAEQWSELKQQDTLRELVSTGLVGRDREKYELSIGAPRRRPPPRLNQIPPLQKTRTELTDLFSSKIPCIERNKTGYSDLFAQNIGPNLKVMDNSNVARKSDLNLAPTNVISVSEAHEKQKLENLEDPHKECSNIHKFDANGEEKLTEIINIPMKNKKSISFLDKEITISNDTDAAPCHKDKMNEKECQSVNDKPDNTVSDGAEESEYFEALNGARYTELQRRKLRLWDIDMM